jgi:hypothetical protein
MLLKIAGYDVLIDEEDYERVHEMMPWHMSKRKNQVYIQRAVGENKKIKLHRFLINAPEGSCVDHISGDTLDNRKSNLRICSLAENSRNSKLSKANTSGYKGVSFDKKNGKWRAFITKNRKQYSLGYFETPEEAYRAYCEASKKYHGEFGRIA